MSIETTAERYAQAIFEIGNESGQLPRLTQEMARIGEAYGSSAELRAVLDNPLVDEPARKTILREVAERLGAGPITKNALGLLAQRRRLVLLPYIARALDRLSDEKTGAVRATVTSATALSEPYYARLKEQLERATGKTVVLERAVDPSLLGGVVTRVGDRVIDGSLRTRLSSLRASLLQTT